MRLSTSVLLYVVSYKADQYGPPYIWCGASPQPSLINHDTGAPELAFTRAPVSVRCAPYVCFNSWLGDNGADVCGFKVLWRRGSA
jgi:hypothetical protein